MAVRRSPTRRPGRPAGVPAGESREQILVAARELFAKSGFARTTIRGVASRANVDAALVHYFFGSKAELFTAVIELPVPVEDLAALLDSAQRPLGKRVVLFFLEQVFSTRNQAIAAMLRAAVADPGSVPALRARVEKQVVAVLAGAFPGEEGRLRAEILGAQFIGLFVMRHLVRLEPIASATPEAIARILGPSIDLILQRD